MMNPLETLFLRHGEKLHPTIDHHILARDAVLANDVKLIFVDEAEQLHTEGLEGLRSLFETTGCAVLLIGR